MKPERITEKFWSKSFLSKIYRKFSGAYFHRAHTYIAFEIGKGNPTSVLDIACGGGDFLEVAKHCVPTAKLFGTDLAEGMVQYSQKRLGESVEILITSAQSQPFPTESMDVVTIMMAFHHIEDKKAVLKEVKRLLKQKGAFVVFDVMSRSHIEKKLWNFSEKAFGIRGPVFHYTLSDFETLAREAGFTVKKDSFFRTKNRYKIYFCTKN